MNILTVALARSLVVAAFLAVPSFADDEEETLNKDLTAVIALHGLPCGQVVAVTAVSDGVLRVSSGRVPLPQRDELVLIVDAGTTPREGRVLAADDGRLFL